MPQPLPPAHHNLLLLNIYFAFRIGLGFSLLLFFLVSANNRALGATNPELYFWTCALWILLSTLSLLFFPARSLVRSFHRITSFLVLDVMALLLLIQASGGVDSGFGYLLLVIVAIGSIFIRKKMGLLFAVMVSLLMMAQTVYLVEYQELGRRSIFTAGLLGALLLITGYSFQLLTEKIHISSQEAFERSQYAEHLQRLAQAIITRMRTGILVLDDAQRIELINTAAQQFLGLPNDQPVQSSQDLPHLQRYLNADDNDIQARHQRLDSGLEVRFSRANIEQGANKRQVIFVEDYRAIAQQAQQLKLASLGRLTASIAHEIRNPLGAISHAAQLLQESGDLAPLDKRLADIIYQHSKRVNQIVENTLSLSRRKDPQVSQINLREWLEQFADSYTNHQDAHLDLAFQQDPLPLRIDTTNLQQVVVNLVDNGLRYSKQKIGEARVRLNAGINPANDTVFLEVIDFGPGIAEDALGNLFEPFYTTETLGTGLGLYICKELCEINQASLYYCRTQQGESCFRIDFSHHLRMI